MSTSPPSAGGAARGSAPGPAGGIESPRTPPTGGSGGDYRPQRGPGQSPGPELQWPPRPSGRGASLLRPFLVVCIFVLAAALYSAHFTDVMDRLRSERAVSDAAGLLSPEDVKLAADFGKILHRRLGLELRLATFAGEVKAPDLDPRTIFIGLGGGVAVVVLPVLAERALGPEAANYLEKEHFPPYLAEGRAGEGLRRALKLLWDGLIGPGETNES